MPDVLLVALQMALQIALPAAIVRRDLRRLRPEQVASTWPRASFWSAIVVFGLLCLPFHFVKSRRSWAGLLLGLAWLAIGLLLSAAASWLLSWILGT